MSIILDRISFEGPLEMDGKGLPTSSGVYFISTESAGGMRILGIYCADDILYSFQSNEKRDCWTKHRDDGLGVYYGMIGTPKKELETVCRKMINDRFYALPCVTPVSDDF
ncbi:MAG: hypothetical protein WC067_00715 [Candidatus Methanomethylophilaceae archaeon]